MGVFVLFCDKVFADTVEFIRYMESQEKQLVVEVVRSRLISKEYSPPYEMPVYTSKEELRYDTPENAIASLAAAAKNDWMEEARKNYFRHKGELNAAPTGHPWYDFENNYWVFVRRVEIPGGLWLWAQIREKDSERLIAERQFFVSQWEKGHWGRGVQYIDYRQKMFARRAAPYDDAEIRTPEPTKVHYFRHWIDKNEVPLPNPLKSAP